MELTREENDIINHLYSCYLGATTTLTRQQLRSILLYSEGWFTVAGHKCLIKSRYIAAGVYEIWFEKEK